MSSHKKSKVIQIHSSDNVLVALTDLYQGERIEFDDELYLIQNHIPAKHKFFTQNLEAGNNVIMYGVLVGKVQVDVKKGSLMTTENTKHATQEYELRKTNYQWHAPDISHFKNKTFNGYYRKDGKVGTANYWLFIPTVFCENRNMDVIKEALQNTLGYTSTDKYKRFVQHLIEAYKEGRDIINESLIDISYSNHINERLFKNIDGIKFLTHNGGCGGTRQDAATLSKLLAAYADHPNVAGITVLSLGCQHLQVTDFLKDVKDRNSSFDKPIIILEQQELESEESLIHSAIQQTFIHLIEANKLERKPASLDKLCIGVKCGGSDGFSGISANPSVGHCADLLVALGGKVLLAEFPELCGVEQDLIDRCTTEDIANKFIGLMKSYNELAHAVGSGFQMNPSPGNIKDGLITDSIKSAGACKKGGSSPVTDVLDYTEAAVKPGLNLVCTPGNDVESTTGKTASGATLILFTTGLGTPTGNPICPVIKVSSNNKLAERMSDIIDINAGGVIDGIKSIEEMGTEILEFCIKVASGEIIPKVVLLSQDDFIPWKRGVSL